MELLCFRLNDKDRKPRAVIAALPDGSQELGLGDFEKNTKVSLRTLADGNMGLTFARIINFEPGYGFQRFRRTCAYRQGWGAFFCGTGDCTYYNSGTARVVSQLF